MGLINYLSLNWWCQDFFSTIKKISSSMIPSKIEWDLTNGPNLGNCSWTIRYSGFFGVCSVGPTIGDFFEKTQTPGCSFEYFVNFRPGESSSSLWASIMSSWCSVFQIDTKYVSTSSFKSPSHQPVESCQSLKLPTTCVFFVTIATHLPLDSTKGS